MSWDGYTDAKTPSLAVLCTSQRWASFANERRVQAASNGRPSEGAAHSAGQTVELELVTAPPQ